MSEEQMKAGCALCRPSPDEQVICQSEKWRIILADDAMYPGFCRVIWHGHIAEMTDLSMPDRQELMAVVFSVEGVLRDVMHPDKVNLASLGNRVPHLHWHVIPRFFDDAHFPDSVWGTKQRIPDARRLEERYARLPELKAEIRQMLKQQIKAV